MEFIDKQLQEGEQLSEKIVHEIFPHPNTGTPDNPWKKFSRGKRQLYRDMVNILKREQNGRCCYCMKRLESDDCTIEHVIPKSVNLQGYNSYLTQNQHTLLPDRVCHYDNYVNVKPHPNIPPCPHIYSYYNMVLSCKGCASMYGNGAFSSCNLKRNDAYIEPFVYYANIKQEFQYYSNTGMVVWVNDNTANSEVVTLGLNDDALKLIRRMWYVMQSYPGSFEVNAAFNMRENQRSNILAYIYGSLINKGMSKSEEDTFQSFYIDAYWKTFILYDYFRNIVFV